MRPAMFVYKCVYNVCHDQYGDQISITYARGQKVYGNYRSLPPFQIQ